MIAEFYFSLKKHLRLETAIFKASFSLNARVYDKIRFWNKKNRYLHFRGKIKTLWLKSRWLKSCAFTVLASAVFEKRSNNLFSAELLNKPMAVSFNQCLNHCALFFALWETFDVFCHFFCCFGAPSLCNRLSFTKFPFSTNYTHQYYTLRIDGNLCF